MVTAGREAVCTTSAQTAGLRTEVTGLRAEVAALRVLVEERAAR